MTIVEALADGSCAPTGLKVDIRKLQNTATLFTEKLFSLGGKSYKDWNASRETYGLAAMNLTHHQSVSGRERFFKFTGNRLALGDKMNETEFTVKPVEVTSSYLGEVMQMVENHHQERFGTAFIGRYQFIWVHPGRCYPLHVDEHTPHRYHIPVYTDADCLWLFRKAEELSLLHMPADGRVWYLDPIQQEHSVANFGRKIRLHLHMTSGE